MNRWLEKIQKGPDTTPSKPPKSPLEGLEGVVTGASEKKHEQVPAPHDGIDILLANLRRDYTGTPLHSIDGELETAIREAMGPMGREDRAELAADIDDLLGLPDGRERVMQLLEQRTQPAWVEWVGNQVPLVHEDRVHIATWMARLHPKLQERLARRYVETWQEAATAEPVPHKRDNAGRRAANLIITRLKTKGGACHG